MRIENPERTVRRIDEMLPRGVPPVRSRPKAAIPDWKTRHDAKPRSAATEIDLEGAVRVPCGVPQLDRVAPHVGDLLKADHIRVDLPQRVEGRPIAPFVVVQVVAFEDEVEGA